MCLFITVKSCFCYRGHSINGLKFVKKMLTSSKIICLIHQYWFLHKKRFHCCCICQSQTMYSEPIIWSVWRVFFNGEANFKGSRIGAVLITESRQYYPVIAKLYFPWTNNMIEYKACILNTRLATNMSVQELLVIGNSDMLIHQVQGEWVVKNSKITPYLQ